MKSIDNDTIELPQTTDRPALKRRNDANANSGNDR